MAWDGLIFKAPPDVGVADLPNDFRMEPLGTTEEIHRALASLIPSAIHSDRQCVVESDEFWLELNYSSPNHLGVHESIGVRTNAGRGVSAILKAVCNAFNARLIYCQTTEFADFGRDTEASMTKFAEWRDRVLQQYESDD